MVALVCRPHFLPHRVQEPDTGDAGMDVVLPDLQTGSGIID